MNVCVFVHVCECLVGAYGNIHHQLVEDPTRMNVCPSLQPTLLSV